MILPRLGAVILLYLTLLPGHTVRRAGFEARFRTDAGGRNEIGKEGKEPDRDPANGPTGEASAGQDAITDICGCEVSELDNSRSTQIRNP